MRNILDELRDVLGRLLLEPLRDGQRRIAYHLEDLHIDTPVLRNDCRRRATNVTKAGGRIHNAPHSHKDNIAYDCQ